MFDFGHGPDDGARPLGQAVGRGFRQRCPRCGAGPLMHGYLKVRDNCAVCGEALHHHRADDGPAYLTILIVGHLMAPLILWACVACRPGRVVVAASTARIVGYLAISAASVRTA